ncbi:MAG: hypothetical protein ACOY5B_10500 [Spirochaetota bacterium]
MPARETESSYDTLRRVVLGMILMGYASSLHPDNPANIRVEHIPILRAYKGGNLQIVAVIPAAGLVRTVTAYYYFSNAPVHAHLRLNQFRSVALKGENGRFLANIPVLANESNRNLYYFLRIQTSTGELFLPDRPDSHLNAYKVAVLADTIKPTVRLLTPGEDAEMVPGAFRLEYAVQDSGSGVNPARLRFYLNDVEYSKSLIVQGNIVKFDLPPNLPEGQYTHTLIAEDYAGNKLSGRKYRFRLSQEISDVTTEVTPKPWKGSGSISYGYNGNIPNIRRREDFSLESLRKTEMHNLSAQYTATDGDTVVTLGPATISTQPATPGVRPNRFAFGMQKKNFEMKWGDISSQISSLTLNTSMLGAHMGYKTDKDPRAGRIDVRAAYGQTKQAYESQPGGLSGAYARNSIGSYLGYNLSKGLLAYGAYQSTRDIESSLRDKRGAPIFENQTAEGGMQWEIPDWKLKLTTRYAISVTEARNPSSGDTNFRQQGYSTASSATWLIKPLELNLGLSFDQTSQNFSVMSGGGAAPDRRSLTLTLARTFFKGICNWSSNNSAFHNNLKKERPETQYNYNAANNLALNFPKLPSINYSNNVLISQSTGVGDVRTETLTNNNTLGLSYGYDLLFKQTLNANGSLAAVRDQSSPAKGNDSDSYGVNGGWQAQFIRQLGLNLNAGRTENINRLNGEANLSQTLSAALNLSFFSGKLTESLNFNQNQNFSRKQSVTTLISTSYMYGLSTHLTPSESMKFTLNCNYSVSVAGGAAMTSYPANLAISFQFTMQIKDYEEQRSDSTSQRTESAR